MCIRDRNNGIAISLPNDPLTTFEFSSGGSYTINVLTENGQCQNSASQSIEITDLSLEEPFISISGVYYSATEVNDIITFPICTGVSSPTVTIENGSYYRVDISKAPLAKKKYRVRMAPTLILFKDGVKEVTFKAGLDLLLPTNLEEVQEAINELNESNKF